MSLFSSLQLGANTLQVDQIGLQVAGQNISNANTPGYIRERLLLQTADPQKSGNLILGLGVRAQSVQQVVDKLLDQRLRAATSDAANTQAQADTYQQIETYVGALDSNNLNASLNSFTASVNDVLNQPTSVPVRNLAVLKGQSLAGDINQLASRVSDFRKGLNDQVDQAATQINTLVEQIRTLNLKITETEGGAVGKSDAVGLRDQRNTALKSLSQLIDVRTQEQSDGSVNVFTGGEYLVFEGTSRSVNTVATQDRGQTVDNLQLADTKSALHFISGSVAGLIASRDTIAGGFLDQLNSFAGTLAFNFNNVYASGQGLNGYTQLTSQSSVAANEIALDAAGLANPPVNGSFQIQVLNTKTGQTQTTNINVNLHGLDSDTSLNTLASQISSVSGLSATATSDGRLKIQSNSSDLQFSFAGDTSHVLASLGLNTFFTGNDASSIGINKDVIGDPSKFAASGGGVGEDTQNALKLTQFIDQPIDSQQGNSIGTIYNNLVANVTQASSVAKSSADGNSVFQKSLESQQLSVQGVNIDEETINIIQYQRSYQATAKFISTISDLLDTLVKL